MIKRFLVGFGLLMSVLVSTVVFAPAAYAWHATVTGDAVCNQETGKFDLTWHIANSEAGNVMNVASASGNGLPPNLVGASVPGGGSIDRTLTGQSSGSYTLTVNVTWTGSEETASATATISTSGECEAPTTTTAPATTTTQPSTTTTIATTTTKPTVQDVVVTPTTVVAASLPQTGSGDEKIALAVIALMLIGFGLAVRDLPND